MIRFLKTIVGAAKTLAVMVFYPEVVKCRRFCVKWARLSSAEFEFRERHETIWEFPYCVEFYDLHRWAGEHVHWNGHDVGSGNGKTLNEAWKDMADRIVEYENAASREEAIFKAELKLSRARPRGWGNLEYDAFYQLNLW